MLSPIWQLLSQHKTQIDSLSLRKLFADHPERAQQFSTSAAGLFLDYSKNRITPETLSLLTQLATDCQLQHWIEAQFSGQTINHTEQRAVLHTALRAPAKDALTLAGENLSAKVEAQLAKMQLLVEAIHSGAWRGYSQEAITDIVNIGIGGSDLGPRMVVKALTPFQQHKVKVHFVANVDGTDLSETLKPLNPATTLFIVASKSFSTQETLMNAMSARTWLLNAAQDPHSTAKHFVAISSRPDKAKAFGIDEANCFEMWDWVGGRYSLWSTIGLPIALSVGMTHFKALLAGAHNMDQHFRSAPFSHNLPVIMALLGVWYVNFHGSQSQAILPYDEYLSLLPSYLQQADMESNGKSVDRNGKALTHASGPVIWGGVGTNGQHAFHQLLHQGTLLIPADFIVALKNHHALPEHHAALYANALAQAQALMQGKTLEEAHAELIQQGLADRDAKLLAPHKVIAGNKPSNMLLMQELNPETLGALIALYEHKIFVQSVIWNINAFDQWGVELGKQLGGPILDALTSQTFPAQLDSSTIQLIKRFNHPTH